jgi:hypothetical protein
MIGMRLREMQVLGGESDRRRRRPHGSPPLSRGDPRTRPTDHHNSDQGDRAERPIPVLLHRRGGGRRAGRQHRGSPGPGGGQAAVEGLREADARPGRRPTKRYGPRPGPGVHRKPAPVPGGSPYVYGHVFLVLGLLVARPAWGMIALPLSARIYVRKKDLPGINPKHRPALRTRLELGVELLRCAMLRPGISAKSN